MSLAAGTLLGAGALGSAPTLVIFPFREADGFDPRYGPDYVNKLGSALKVSGAVKVVMGDPATVPADYLHTAKADNGDYYLIGFVAPPANGQMSVIEQIVSARSGTVIWSSTAHIGADKDILDQAPVVQNALLAYATRGYYAILNPTPKPAPQPSAPPQKKNGVVGGAGAGGGGGGQPKPPLELAERSLRLLIEAHRAAENLCLGEHPARFVVLAITGRTVPPVIRAYTVSSMLLALQRHGQTVAEGNPETTEHPIVRGPDICTQTGAGYLVFGSVATKSSDATSGNDIWTDAALNVAVYDCGAQKFEQMGKPLHGVAFNWRTAVDHAVNSAVTDYLLKVATVARS